jgi:hypothetical protein
VKCVALTDQMWANDDLPNHPSLQYYNCKCLVYIPTEETVPTDRQVEIQFARMMMIMHVSKLWYFFHKCGIIITHVVILIHVGYSRKLSNVLCINSALQLTNSMLV